MRHHRLAHRHQTKGWPQSISAAAFPLRCEFSFVDVSATFGIFRRVKTKRNGSLLPPPGRDVLQRGVEVGGTTGSITADDEAYRQ